MTNVILGKVLPQPDVELFEVVRIRCQIGYEFIALRGLGKVDLIHLLMDRHQVIVELVVLLTRHGTPLEDQREFFFNPRFQGFRVAVGVVVLGDQRAHVRNTFGGLLVGDPSLAVIKHHFGGLLFRIGMTVVIIGSIMVILFLWIDPLFMYYGCVWAVAVAAKSEQGKCSSGQCELGIHVVDVVVRSPSEKAVRKKTALCVVRKADAPNVSCSCGPPSLMWIGKPAAVRGSAP